MIIMMIENEITIKIVGIDVTRYTCNGSLVIIESQKYFLV
jgi:hypothetical protein